MHVVPCFFTCVVSQCDRVSRSSDNHILQYHICGDDYCALFYVLFHTEADTKEVLITIDKNQDNQEILELSEDLSMDCLLKAVHSLFDLQSGSINRLQIWSEKFRGFVNLKDMCKIQDGCKINVS